MDFFSIMTVSLALSLLAYWFHEFLVTGHVSLSGQRAWRYQPRPLPIVRPRTMPSREQALAEAQRRINEITSGFTRLSQSARRVG